MSNSFSEIKAAMGVLLTTAPDSQVKVVEQEWCYGNNNYLYVYDGGRWYESYHVEDYTKVEVVQGFVQMFDDLSHCGSYTALVPHNLEVTYEQFKSRYGQGSLL